MNLSYHCILYIVLAYLSIDVISISHSLSRVLSHILNWRFGHCVWEFHIVCYWMDIWHSNFKKLPFYYSKCSRFFVCSFVKLAVFFFWVVNGLNFLLGFYQSMSEYQMPRRTTCHWQGTNSFPTMKSRQSKLKLCQLWSIHWIFNHSLYYCYDTGCKDFI